MKFKKELYYPMGPLLTADLVDKKEVVQLNLEQSLRINLNAGLHVLEKKVFDY